MPFDATRDLVPREFVGQARALISRVDAASHGYAERVRGLVVPLDKRWRRDHHPRQELLMAAARGWPRLPAYGRLDLRVEHDRRSMAIAELRVVSANFTFSGWDDRRLQDGIAVDLITFTCDRERIEWDCDDLCYVSLHALARRIERGYPTADEAIFHDLAVLAARHADLIGPNNFLVPLRSGGRWVGNSASFRRQRTPVLQVRSFLSETYAVEAA